VLRNKKPRKYKSRLRPQKERPPLLLLLIPKKRRKLLLHQKDLPQGLQHRKPKKRLKGKRKQQSQQQKGQRPYAVIKGK
jgi:hypothetical protein